MRGGIWSLICPMRSGVLLTVLCGAAVAAPATAPPGTRPTPKRVLALVNLPPNAESVTVQLRRAGHLLHAPVQIDGKDAGWFLLDTGSSNTVVDASVVKRLGFETQAGVELWTPSKGLRTDLFRYHDLQVGQISMRNGFAGVADLSVMTSTEGFPVAGVLGNDLLREQPFAIDFRLATLTLYSRKHFEPPASPAFPLMFHIGCPSVQASIESHSAPILIDTGGDTGLDLEPVFMDMYNVSVVGRHSEFWALAVAGGVENVAKGLFGPMKILGRQIESIETTCPLQNEVGSATPAGHFGTAFLQDACLTFDYKTKKAWVDWRQQRQSTDALLRELGDLKSQDLAGVTPLMRAAELGRDDVVADLLKRGADVNARSKRDLTALLYAAINRHPRVVKQLLSAGADPNICAAWGNLSPLSRAAANGDAESVKALLLAHATVDARTTSGETALVTAAGAGYPEVVGLLLAGGADIGAATKDEVTAINIAAGLADPQMLDLLIKHGANVNRIAGTAGAPLIAATFNNNVKNIKFLLDHGADVNGRGPRGPTALMVAASKGYEAAVQTLLEGGADPSVRSNEGKTAADYTRSLYVRSALIAAADAHVSPAER